MTDIEKTQDAIIEIAKDLLMLDLEPLLAGLAAAGKPDKSDVLPVRFASQDKTEAFHQMVEAFAAAQAGAEEFRKAHVADRAVERAHLGLGPVPIQDDIPDEYPNLSQDDIERRRAS